MLMGVCLGYRVRSQALRHLEWMCQRFGLRRVDGLQLVNQLDNARKLACEVRHFSLGDFEAGELTEFLNGFGLEWHCDNVTGVSHRMIQVAC